MSTTIQLLSDAPASNDDGQDLEGVTTFPRSWERVHDVYVAPNGATSSQQILRLKVPGGWLISRPGVYTLCFVPDPTHAWVLEARAS